MQQGAGDLDPPHLADRKIADAIPAAIGHRHAIQHLRDEAVGTVVGDAVQRRVIQQVLPDRNIDIERTGLKHDAELAQGRARLASDFVAENADLARSYRVEPRDQREHRRLAGAVQSQQHGKG